MFDIFGNIADLLDSLTIKLFNDIYPEKPIAIVISTNLKLSERYMLLYLHVDWNYINSGTLRIFKVFNSDNYVLRVKINADDDINKLQKIRDRLIKEYNINQMDKITYLKTNNSLELENNIKNVFENFSILVDDNTGIINKKYYLN